MQLITLPFPITLYNRILTSAYVSTNGTIQFASTPSLSLVWPPDHRMVPVGINGVSDPDGDPFTLKVTDVRRVYHIFYSATDNVGASCNGEVTVGVPHDQGKGSVPVDGGPIFSSLVP